MLRMKHQCSTMNCVIDAIHGTFIAIILACLLRAVHNKWVWGVCTYQRHFFVCSPRLLRLIRFPQRINWTELSCFDFASSPSFMRPTRSLECKQHVCIEEISPLLPFQWLPHFFCLPFRAYAMGDNSESIELYRYTYFRSCHFLAQHLPLSVQTLAVESCAFTFVVLA